MESKHKTLLHSFPTMKELFALPKDRQRFLWYSGKINQKDGVIVSYSEFEEKLIYSETKITVRMAGHLYPQRTSRKGFTLDKQTKKLQLWYNSQPSDFEHLGLLLRELGKEWVINEKLLGARYHGWLTKGLLEKILLGKITNPSDAVKYIIKANRIKGATPKYLKEYIKNGHSKINLLKWTNHITRIDDILTNQTANHHYILDDTLKQAKILGRTIDMNWSKKRLEEIHKEWTKEIMAIELETLENEVVEYKESFDFLPPSIELIRDRKRLFVEGKEMGHCVYTNYWELVKERRYMVWHVEQEDGGEPLTVGIRIESSQYYIEQALGRYNQVLPSKKTADFLDQLIESDQFVNAMKKEFWSNAGEDFKPSVRAGRRYPTQHNNVPDELFHQIF